MVPWQCLESLDKLLNWNSKETFVPVTSLLFLSCQLMEITQTKTDQGFYRRCLEFLHCTKTSKDRKNGKSHRGKV